MLCLRSAQCYQLPPTKDALRKHVARACYQAAIWRRALVCNPDTPSPHLHGWILRENQLYIDWMEQPPAPQGILELVSCGCKSDVSCTTGKCSCFKNGLPCTGCCCCLDCGNPIMSGAHRNAEVHSDSDEDESDG